MRRRSGRDGWMLVGGMVVALLGLGVQRALAVDNSYVPATGGLWTQAGNWSLGHVPTATETPIITAGNTANKIVTYNTGAGVSYPIVRIDGHSSGYYGMILHTQYALTTTEMRISSGGPGWHWMEGPAYLWVNDNLYIGNAGAGTGHFYMNTAFNYSAGLYVGDLCYVGYGSPGDFDHTGGIAQVYRLYVGQNDPGTYYLRGGRLEIENQFVLGNGAAGTFEQTGGAVDQSGFNGLIMGLNTGGAGTYLMKAGTLDIDHISLAWNGDAYFTQSGGTVNTVGDINLGCQGTHPMQAWYKLNQDDGTAVLNIGHDLLVGVQTYAKYEQNAGTCNVAGDLEIWKGSTTSSSAVYLGANAGLLDVAGSVVNHTGYYSQLGGVMSTSHFTNDSPDGVYLGNTGDFRATNLAHTAGTFQMFNNSKLRGELAMPPSTYFMCNFTNDATFQMGTNAANGGTISAHLTNNGTFNYYQGDFSGSTLTNYGTFNCYGPFTCNRLVQNAYSFTVTSSMSLTALGTGYASAIENNQNFTLRPGGTLACVNAPLVNNGNLYAGGALNGDLDNRGYFLPSPDSAINQLQVTGDFTQATSGELRIRLAGTSPGTTFDRVLVSGAATLAGELDVRLSGGFTPAIGNSFTILRYASRSGQFNPVNLPTLPADRSWQVEYGTTGLILRVVAAPTVCRGDANCDDVVSWRDIDFFVAAMNDNVTAWTAMFAPGSPTCAFDNNDVNADGTVNWRDIDALVALMNTACP